MELTIKNIVLEDYVHHQPLYSKNIRGNFNFLVEPHILDRGKIVQINFFRNEQDIKSLMEDWKDNGDLKETKLNISDHPGILRLYINEGNIMINNTGHADIKVIEYNYSQGQVNTNDRIQRLQTISQPDAYGLRIFIRYQSDQQQ
jgi:hypothetical protein